MFVCPYVLLLDHFVRNSPLVRSTQYTYCPSSQPSRIKWQAKEQSDPSYIVTISQNHNHQGFLGVRVGPSNLSPTVAMVSSFLQIATALSRTLFNLDLVAS